ncbi:MAG: HAD-IIB family hydrolase [Thermodesulfobacteriota bacterium]
MQLFKEFPSQPKSRIQFVLTDIDDTLTVHGRLPSVVFSAMEKLEQNSILVIPITGRPAGWCDHIARMWPVAGLVGENGAFYFRYDTEKKKMIRRYFKSEEARRNDRIALDAVKQEILKKVPGARVSADQAYREADLAIDFCEDVPPLSAEAIDNIVQIFLQAGAQSKESSIHVNGWFGNYDKLTMSQIFFDEVFKLSLDQAKNQVLYIGDSPNDCPLFAFFPHSVGVANILDFKGRLEHEPAWITDEPGGHGFAEMARILLSR